MVSSAFVGLWRYFGQDALEFQDFLFHWLLSHSRNIHCVSKKVPTFKLPVALSNLNRFSKFLQCRKAYEICYKIHTTLAILP